jgi:O-acetyl-ADP-ribose deacetylase (regulator of RNase III)
MRIRLWQGDITALAVDAIVNAANSGRGGGGGVDGAIHRAGGPAILAACRELRRTTHRAGLPTGQAVATTAGNLHAQWVIHTVGPIHSGDPGQVEQLRDCYRNSLAVADSLGARTLAFPLISAGVYGWPVRDAIRQALLVLSTTRTDVSESTLVLFSPATAALAAEVAADLGVTTG